MIAGRFRTHAPISEKTFLEVVEFIEILSCLATRNTDPLQYTVRCHRPIAEFKDKKQFGITKKSQKVLRLYNIQTANNVIFLLTDVIGLPFVCSTQEMNTVKK